jgi:hypothetical protein
MAQRADTETVMLNLFQYQYDGGEYKDQILNAPHSSYEPPSVILNLFQDLVFHSTKTDTETVMLNLFQYQYDGGEYKDQILKRVQHDGGEYKDQILKPSC